MSLPRRKDSKQSTRRFHRTFTRTFFPVSASSWKTYQTKLFNARQGPLKLRWTDCSLDLRMGRLNLGGSMRRYKQQYEFISSTCCIVATEDQVQPAQLCLGYISASRAISPGHRGDTAGPRDHVYQGYLPRTTVEARASNPTFYPS